jgi:hypothetical protein
MKGLILPAAALNFKFEMASRFRYNVAIAIPQYKTFKEVYTFRVSAE